MEDKFIRKLLSNVKCKHCGQHCEPANIDLLGHQEDLWLFSMYCSSCYSRVLVAAAFRESEVPEAVTELTEAEKSKLSAPIISDDVLDMHIFLNDFSGDFSSLFSEE